MPCRMPKENTNGFSSYESLGSLKANAKKTCLSFWFASFLRSLCTEFIIYLKREWGNDIVNFDSDDFESQKSL